MINPKLDGIIDHAIPAHKWSNMYRMHKYWARKPANVVNKYIDTYSKKNEIVLDPFNGSGVTVLEALKLDRKAIGVDADPTSIFITKATAIKIDLDELKETFENIKIKLVSKIDKYYYTICIDCKKKSRILQVHIKNNEPEKIQYECCNCKCNNIKIFDDIDKKNLKKIDKTRIPYWVPKTSLVWNSRVNVGQSGMKVTDLFSHRNLIVLSIIYHEIEKIKDEDMQLILKFTFTSALAQCSKLLGKTEGSGPSWKIRGFWMPTTRFELNVWHYFENRFRKIVKGKEESNLKIGDRYKTNLTLHNLSSTDLSIIDTESVDYIFTDPPYGDSVPYFELNMIWSSWLKMEPDLNDEIIITDSPVRKDKNMENYSKLIRNVYKELFRVLKPGKYMTITFHNTDIALYNLMIRSAIITGFALEKSVYQPTSTVSVKAQLAPYGSAIGDYYIRFKKPKSTTNMINSGKLDKKIYENIIIRSVKEIIAERGEPTAYKYIINSYSLIYSELRKRGYLFTVDDGIDDILKKNVEIEFQLITKDGQRLWWFKDPKSINFLEQVPLSERVENVIINKLNQFDRVSYDDILQDVYLKFPNAMTPDTVIIKTVLEEYAEKTQDKKWKMKYVVKNRKLQHDILIDYICEIGKKCDYEVYGDTSKNRKELTFDVSSDVLTRLKNIDAIWYSNNKINTIFEVENSTGITEAIVRGSNINYKIQKIIVIPIERERLLIRKLKEPMLSERLANDPWLFIRYDDLMEYYDKHKRKSKVDPKLLFKLHKLPHLSRQAKLA